MGERNWLILGKFEFEYQKKTILKEYYGFLVLPKFSNAKKDKVQSSISKLFEVAELSNEILMEKKRPEPIEKTEFQAGDF